MRNLLTYSLVVLLVSSQAWSLEYQAPISLEQAQIEDSLSEVKGVRAEYEELRNELKKARLAKATGVVVMISSVAGVYLGATRAMTQGLIYFARPHRVASEMARDSKKILISGTAAAGSAVVWNKSVQFVELKSEQIDILEQALDEVDGRLKAAEQSLVDMMGVSAGLVE